MKSPYVGHTSLLALAVLFGCLGCRSPWTRMQSSEPSFQGLLDAEREDARLSSKRPLFTRNRPGDGHSDAVESYAQRQAAMPYNEADFASAEYSRSEFSQNEFSDTITRGATYPDAGPQGSSTEMARGQSRRQPSQTPEFPLDSATQRELAEAESAYGEEYAEIMQQSLLAARSKRPETPSEPPRPENTATTGYSAHLSDTSSPEHTAQDTRRIDDRASRRLPPAPLADPARAPRTDRAAYSQDTQSMVMRAGYVGSRDEGRAALPSSIEARMRQRSEELAYEHNEPVAGSDSMRDWPPENVDWEDAVRTAISGIETEITNTTNPERKSLLEKNSRLLSLTVGDISAAMEPVSGVDKHVQKYLQHSMQAWTDVTDPDGHPESRKRATLALHSQRKAIQNLAAASDLKVARATFCTAVESFGDIKEFSEFRFQAGQEVLLYFEVDNFVSLPVPDGENHETHLRGSYKIVERDSGYPVDEQSLKEDRHVSRIPRRDYFMVYRIWMPKAIEPGRYSMQLAVEDVNGHKFGEASIDFRIGE